VEAVSWPPDPDEIAAHDEKADAERIAKGLDFTRKDVCDECGTINGHTKACSKH
jgi:hypothetical protein